MLIPCALRGKLILKLFLKWKDFNRDILIKLLLFTWQTNFSSSTVTYINLRHLFICQIWLNLAKDPERILGDRQMFTLGNTLLLYNTYSINKCYGNNLKNGSFLLIACGKGLSVVTDQEYFFPGHIHKALASALSKKHVCVYSLLLLETLFLQTGLGLCSARPESMINFWMFTGSNICTAGILFHREKKKTKKGKKKWKHL